MQSYRIYATTPSTARIALRRAPSCAAAPRSMAYCTPFGYRVARRSQPAPSFFPSMAADFSPFLRMFDELESLTSAAATANSQPARTFQPRFDVREEKDAYHLQGELPGVNQEDLSIEFTDPTTLVVRGSTVREHQAGTPPQAAAVEAASEAPKAIEQDTNTEVSAEQPERAVSPVSSESGSNYQRPSVEEDRDDEEWTEAVPTPATAAPEAAEPAQDTAAVEKAPEQPQQQEQKQDDSHYWVSERSVGTFQRTFTFPGQVDQEAVTASLKDGILNVVVPKQQPKQLRKITIQ